MQSTDVEEEVTHADLDGNVVVIPKEELNSPQDTPNLTPNEPLDHTSTFSPNHTLDFSTNNDSPDNNNHHHSHGLAQMEEDIKSGVSELEERIAEQVAEEVGKIEEEIAEAKRLGTRGLVRAYFHKFKGLKQKRPPRVHLMEVLWSWIAAFVGIGALAALHFHFLTHEHLVLVVGSFGASAVLLYGSYTSPLAQPRNFVGGHIISAIIGVSVRWAVYEQSVAIASAFAVATAIAAMQLTNTVHPPGGATALIAVTSAQMAWGGYLYVFMPILTGCAVMLAAALIMNNMFPSRTYPQFWW